METDVSVQINDEVGQSLLDPAEVERIAAAVLWGEGVPVPCEVSVSFVDEERIHELNREWRGIDKPTDVLSFAIDDPDDFDLDDQDDPETFETAVFMAGDVILCPSVIAAQAAPFGNTVADEARLLLVHGCLHLMGYDHEDAQEAEEMESLEREYLREFCDAAVGDINVGPTVDHAAEGTEARIPMAASDDTL